MDQQKSLIDFIEHGMIDNVRMRAVEKNAVSLGMTTLQMMESAGRSLAELALSYNPGHVLILCGKGNNGGDGMVAARYLQQGIDTSVCYHDNFRMSKDAALQLRLLRHSSASLFPVKCRENVIVLSRLFEEADVIIDSLLGTGGAGPLREPYRTCVEMANVTNSPVISADIPTPGMRVDRVLSFHRPKCKDALVADIGIPLEAEIFAGPGDLIMIQKKPATAHKGIGGKVLVIGGGPYQGAPYLAGLGALRAGADLVRVASPVLLQSLDLIHEMLPGDRINESHLPRLLELVKEADVVVCGNGLGTGSHGVIRELIPHCKRAVLDADALRLPLPEAEESIYTPHAGEFTRITGIRLEENLAEKARAVKMAAGRGTILLKGSVDIISDGERVRFNRSGTQAMTVGGTGDVLAGITGALFCQMPSFEAAYIAAYVNGVAGMMAAGIHDKGITASDMLGCIPGALIEGAELEERGE
ncbi:MAG: NAD(P)H-hydrate dehydratase [Methanoregulaceae archaeon]|nr:NAD(P)H-hydrate dehydratase [Methanoregulaceae archaeon]